MTTIEVRKICWICKYFPLQYGDYCNRHYKLVGYKADGCENFELKKCLKPKEE